MMLGIIIFGKYENIHEGDLVRLGKIMEVPVGPGFIKCCGPSSRPLDGLGRIDSNRHSSC